MTPTGDMPEFKQEVLRKQKCPVQVRWDFKEEQQELEDGKTQTIWTFNYDVMVDKFSPFKTYAKDELCWLGDGKVYISEIDDNKNKPTGVGWKEIVYNGVEKAEEQEAKEWMPVTGAHDVYKLGEVVTKDGKKYVSNHPYNSWEPGTLEWKPPQWVSGDYYKYKVGTQVYNKGQIWEAINLTHTWIEPALTGNGAISWKFIKNWNDE